jgi:hypothetical protein
MQGVSYLSNKQLNTLSCLTPEEEVAMKNHIRNELRRWCRIIVFLGAVAIIPYIFSDTRPHLYDIVGYYTAFILGLVARQN